MEEKKIESFYELVAAIIDMVVIDKNKLTPVRIPINDGRKIEGTLYSLGQNEIPDISKKYQVFSPQEKEKIIQCIGDLIYKEKPFITSVGSDDEVCTLKWTIGEIK
jgi:hypothetical protein